MALEKHGSICYCAYSASNSWTKRNQRWKFRFGSVNKSDSSLQ